MRRCMRQPIPRAASESGRASRTQEQGHGVTAGSAREPSFTTATVEGDRRVPRFSDDEGPGHGATAGSATEPSISSTTVEGDRGVVSDDGEGADHGATAGFAREPSCTAATVGHGWLRAKHLLVDGDRSVLDFSDDGGGAGGGNHGATPGIGDPNTGCQTGGVNGPFDVAFGGFGHIARMFEHGGGVYAPGLGQRRQ